MGIATIPTRYLIVILTFICTSVCYVERVGFSIAYTVAADAEGTCTLTLIYTMVFNMCFSTTPSIHTVLAQWVPPHERSRSVSLTTSGMYLGAAMENRQISNHDLAQIIHTSDEWISSRTGIHNQRILTGKETLTGLAVEAAQKALQMAKLEPDDVDLILNCSSTPESLFGGAAEVQKTLGWKRNPPAYDITAACSGFLLGLVSASCHIRVVPQTIEASLANAGLRLSEIDWLLVHQTNQRIIDCVTTKLEFPKDRVISNLGNYGNTSAASIPLALDEAVRSGNVKEGDTIITVGFGAGLTWGSAIVRCQQDTILSKKGIEAFKRMADSLTRAPEDNQYYKKKQEDLETLNIVEKLLKDLKELAEYDQSTSMDRPIFLNDNHPVQNKESPEKSSEENLVSKTNQESPQDSNMHQLIKECFVEVPEEQKQNMEDTMFELVKICHHKQFLCIHDDVDNLIEIHTVTQIQSTKESEHLLSMGYEYLSITPETESDEVTESNAENLLPIPSKCEVTLKYEIECNMPAKDVCSPVFTTFSNPLFKDNDDLDSSNDESLPDEDVPTEEFKFYSNPLCDEDEINSDKLDPHCFNVESDFVESLLNHDTFIDFSSKFYFSGELAHIKPEIPKSDFDFEEEIRLIENLLYDNSFPRPLEELNAEIADTIIESIPLLPIPVQDGNSQQEEIDIGTETDDVMPSSDDNNYDYDLLLEGADLFLDDNSIPPGIENFVDDPEGDIRFLEELLIDDSILSHESFDSNF
nr:3-oxoacyl-[acyl-carrier-protein] synthase 3 A, chloroplastic-like [Tanacetum cinerariifolium]